MFINAEIFKIVKMANNVFSYARDDYRGPIHDVTLPIVPFVAEYNYLMNRKVAEIYTYYLGTYLSQCVIQYLTLWRIPNNEYKVAQIT